jgi:hypothetical protein
VKPGMESDPKILPELPAESEGWVAQVLVGPAGFARYSEGVFRAPAKGPGDREVRASRVVPREPEGRLPSLRWR